MIIKTFRKTKNEDSTAHGLEHGLLVFITSGVLSIRSDSGAWVVPEGRLAWIPRGKKHSTQALWPAEGWSILTDDRFEKILPGEICIIKASPMLLAILDRVVHPKKESKRFFELALSLILEELKTVETENLQVPLPRTFSLATVAHAVMNDLSSLNRLEDWAYMAGKSKRTFTRHFLLETGMTFDQWKKNAINLKAIELLAQGKQVSEVALELGYESASSFISMFKRHVGDTPMKFLKKTK